MWKRINFKACCFNRISTWHPQHNSSRLTLSTMSCPTKVCCVHTSKYSSLIRVVKKMWAASIFLPNILKGFFFVFVFPKVVSSCIVLSSSHQLIEYFDFIDFKMRFYLCMKQIHGKASYENFKDVGIGSTYTWGCGGVCCDGIEIRQKKWINEASD